ncbi:ATP/GTP-binding protein [Sphingomonas sp. OK281]|uniref:AAA family ATPase n=1 Tax=Sphingomonas sp. OK281 TaxID=1881067 RepID=UPI0015879EBA|nr:ATP-binding protein [Sphingomonas sp. OK281]
MLLEFAVTNFKSFANEQTFSLIASNLTDGHQDRVAWVDGPQKLPVLTSAIIMGKNGSGKSSLVEAMRFVRSFVVNSASDGQHGELIDVKVHRLDTEFSSAPCSFRLLFSMGPVVYQYSFAVDSVRVLEERLEIADRTARFRKLFDRVYVPKSESYDYSFGDSLRGDKATWRSATRGNALFLSTANQLNSEQLREPFVWFSTYLRGVDAASGSFGKYTSQHCEVENNRRNIMEFLRSLDIDVEDIRIEVEDISETLSQALSPTLLAQMVKSDPEFVKSRKVEFLHKGTGKGPVSLELSEESTGTRALFGLAGPIFDALANGYCLIVDEINTSLHPLILHRLVEMFSNVSVNRKRAQLIFTSHDTSTLRDGYLRRDQIWFVDKSVDGKSVLVPLSDYSPRKGEALDRGYMHGRYGGIPFIGPIQPLMGASSLWDPVS